MGLWSRSRLLLLLLMIWVPAALSASACTNTDPCVLSCEGCDVNELVPDPENCRYYYICSGSNPNDYYDLAFDCGSGYVFDPITHQCEEGNSCEECLSASACTNTDPCVLSCEGCDVGEYVPDPENCRYYYVCSGSNPNDYYDLVFECDSGYVFDPITHQCEEGDSCEECPAGPCVYECPASGSARIPSFADCNKYYICTSGYVESTETCDATTPFFDGYQCQADESRCCHCHAYCYANSGFVADPLDCRQYYVCLEQGAPTYVATCPDGEYFSSSTQECSEQASCVTQCTNVVGPDGCIEPFTCLYTGLFAKCPNQCTPLYYHCTSATGEYQAVESCEGGTVFHPTSHACVSQVDCP